jgi:N-acetylated-alpha-linked acidic dipeptidase
LNGTVRIGRSQAAFALALASLLSASQGHAAEPQAPITGFPGEASQAQRALEERFAARIKKEQVGESLRELSSEPHHAGSPRSAEIARDLVEQFRSWGFDAKVETFYGLVSKPKVRVLEMVAPHAYQAPLEDGPFPGAPSPDLAGSLPPYSMFSGDGDVTAEAVYVNYGSAGDYEMLARQGIDVRGKIVIARYGKSWRGAKARVAAEKGAAGVILFSDPAQGGYAEGAVYPEGPLLPAEGAQRGSILDLPRMAGDPLTPGQGATRKPASFSMQDVSEWISPIPVQPVSAKEIEPILAAMGGPVVPADWHGGLPVVHRFGDGTVKLRLKIAQDWTVTPLHDVVAKLEGAVWPDEWVMRGNNHDAWNFGAEDAASGLAAMLEEARAIGTLAKEGWRPKRTLVYLAWDGEEAGLFGSTEWVETHADELRRKAVAYLNSGPTARGFFSSGGSHSLWTFVDEIARDVHDPLLEVPVADRVAANNRLQRLEAGLETDAPAATRKFPLAALGMSSDYGAFLQHVGIASLDFTFEGESQNRCYHSICDNFSHFEKFSDPGFAYGAALSEAGGRMMLRLGEAEILPFDFSGMAEALAGYLDEVENIADARRRQVERRNAAIEDGVFGLARDPQDRTPTPELEEPVPDVDFALLRQAQRALADNAKRFSGARAAHAAKDAVLEPAELAQVNAILRSAEQALAPEAGLPGRTWYRHRVYAPDRDTGYESATLPGVREAIERQDWAGAQREIGRAAEAVDAYAKAVNDAATLLLGLTQPR